VILHSQILNPKFVTML